MLEERFDTTIDEPAFASARTIGDLEALVRQAASAMTHAPEGGPANAQSGSRFLRGRRRNLGTFKTRGAAEIVTESPPVTVSMQQRGNRRSRLGSSRRLQIRQKPASGSSTGTAFA